jgi:hypothetical protein
MKKYSLLILIAIVIITIVSLLIIHNTYEKKIEFNKNKLFVSFGGPLDEDVHLDAKTNEIVKMNFSDKREELYNENIKLKQKLTFIKIFLYLNGGLLVILAAIFLVSRIKEIIDKDKK